MILHNTCCLSQNTTAKTDTSLLKDKSIQYYLKQQSSNSFVYKKLYEWLVVSRDSNISKNDIFTEFEKENEKYNNKVIRTIKIKQVSPFAKNILDTIDFSTSRTEKNLSKLRFETRESIIKNNLTFKNGEFIKNHKLKDSERILRSLNFITDALIVVEPANADTSLVDVLVISQDSYPYGIRASVSSSRAQLGFYSTNVFGFGLELEHKIDTRPTRNRNFGIYEKLQWENIYGSYVMLSAEISDQQNSHFYNIGIRKSFFIPEIKYAGGFNIYRNFKIDNQPKTLPEDYDNNYHYKTQDFWAGKSILINADNFFNRSNLTFMGQALLSDYYHLSDSMMLIPRYKSNVSMFGSVSFSKRDFYKNQLIYNYGKTEDVPYGFLSSLNFGFNHNSLKNRYFAGAHFSFAKALIPNKGYLYLSGDIQSYFYHKQPEDSKIRIQTQYISSLKKVGMHRWRSFTSINYIKGYNHSYPNYIFINESTNGIRAFRSNQLSGTNKFVLSTENILFSGKELFGFKMAFFSFYDMAWIANNKKVFNSKPYFSLGGGLRIRNDNLVFNTLQLQFAYFPRIPPGGVQFDFRLSSNQVNNFNQFAPRKPFVDIYK